MRKELRKALLEIEGIKDVLEPTVPNKSTKKPYLVIEQVADTTKQDVVGDERLINVWINCKRTSFKELDIIQSQIINRLNYKVIKGGTNNFTCRYKGASADSVYEDWDLITRSLSFSIIALEKTENNTSDKEVKIVSDYLEKILQNKNSTKINIYKDNWSQDFQIPCVLCRTRTVDTNKITFDIFQIDKEMQIHVVDKNQDRVVQIINRIEEMLLLDEGAVFLENNNKSKLRLAKLVEDRESDMFTKGQITATFRYNARKKEKKEVINVIEGTMVEEVNKND